MQQPDWVMGWILKLVRYHCELRKVLLQLQVRRYKSNILLCPTPFAIGSCQMWGWKFTVTCDVDQGTTPPTVLPLCTEITETTFTTLAAMLINASELYLASGMGAAASNLAQELVSNFLSPGSLQELKPSDCRSRSLSWLAPT